MAVVDPMCSTNSVWREDNQNRSLTEDLIAIESDISALETGKSDSDHTHTGFAAEGHTHTPDSIGAAPASHTHSYAPTTHSHSMSEVTGLTDALSGKADSSHSHAGFAAESHGHSISDVTGLQTALDGKAASGHTHNYAAADHNHDTAYAAKSHTHSYAAPSHTHAQSDVTGLETALAGKANSDHSHPDYALSGHTHTGFAPESHNHGISAITGLLDLLMTASDGNVKQTITGDVLSVIKSWGVGVYTAYSSGGSTSSNSNMPKTSESWRYLIHKTGANFGWVLAFGSSGSIYSNYLDSGNWKGWKAIWDATPSPLWAPSNGTGGYYMTAGHTVTPSKKLSECRNGWILVWSDYNTDEGSTGDYDFTCSVIPKIRPSGDKWAGHSWLFDLPIGMQQVSPYTTETRRMKWLYVYDNKLTGHDANNQNGRNDCVLRAVYEF